MLSDKPKLIFTDIAGKPNIEARLHVSLSQKDETIVRVFDENRTSYQQLKQSKQHLPKPLESFNYALLQCGEALL